MQNIIIQFSITQLIEASFCIVDVKEMEPISNYVLLLVRPKPLRKDPLFVISRSGLSVNLMILYTQAPAIAPQGGATMYIHIPL